MTTENQAAQEEQDTQKAPPIPFIVKGDVMPEDLRHKLTNALQYANSFIIDKQEVPLFGVAVTPKGETLLDGLNHIPRILQGAILSKFVDDADATAVIIISEGYQLPEHLAEAQIKGKTGYEKVSDHPEHFECLRISVEVEGKFWIGSIPFTTRWTEADGHQLEDRPIEMESVELVGGPLMNLLPKNREAMIPDALKEMVNALRDDVGCGTCPACLRRKAEKEAANAAAAAAGEVVPPDTPTQ